MVDNLNLHDVILGCTAYNLAKPKERKTASLFQSSALPADWILFFAEVILKDITSKQTEFFISLIFPFFTDLSNRENINTGIVSD